MSFYEILIPNYDEIFPLAQARVEFVRNRVKEGGKILDVGCATGTLALRLAEQGFLPTGIDIEKAMIDVASSHPNPKGAFFFVGDMEHIPAGPWDCIVCFGNTLVHQDEHGVKRFLNSAAAALHNGPLMLQLLNYDRILREKISALPVIETSDVIFRRRYEKIKGNELKFVVELEKKSTGAMATDSTVLHPLFSEDLSKQLAQSGFSNTEFMGDFHGGEFKEDSYHLVVSAKK